MGTRRETGDERWERFGEYEVGRRLGTGGMAEVHRAVKRGRDGFQRTCALKRMRPELTQKKRYVEAFIKEARLTARLSHPNIRATFDFGMVDGVYYIDMELLDGVDLSVLLRRARRFSGPPPISMSLYVLDQVCDALQYIHTVRTEQTSRDLGIVHRDISPANIMVCDSGHIKVIDFGIAESTLDALRRASKQVKGKLGYLSPEAYAGRNIDVRSDLFSVGVIAHELLTVRRLFRPRSDQRSLERIRARELPRPSEINSAVSPSLDRFVMRALEPAPDDRWPSAGAMRHELGNIARQLGGMFSNHQVARWVDALFRGPSGRLALATPTTPPRPVGPGSTGSDDLGDGVVVAPSDEESVSSGVITVVDTDLESSDSSTTISRQDTAPLPRSRAARGSAPPPAPAEMSATALVARPRKVDAHERLRTVRALAPRPPPGARRTGDSTQIMELDTREALIAMSALAPVVSDSEVAVVKPAGVAEAAGRDDSPTWTSTLGSEQPALATPADRGRPRLAVIAASGLIAGLVGLLAFAYLSSGAASDQPSAGPLDAATVERDPYAANAQPDASIDAAPAPIDATSIDAGPPPRAWNGWLLVDTAEMVRIAGTDMRVPRDYHVTLCVNRKGRFARMRAHDASIERAKEIRRHVRTWAFSPYRHDGIAVPVCFPLTLSR